MLISSAHNSKWIVTWVALVALAPIQGCGLIFQGRTQTVRIETVPEGAMVTLAGVRSASPAELIVPRLRDGTVLRATKSDYIAACRVVPLKRTVLLVILDSVPAALGLLVDKLAGTWPGQYPSQLELTLHPAGDLDGSFERPSDAQIMSAYNQGKDLCGPPGPLEIWQVWYAISLTSVDRPTQPDQRYGKVERIGDLTREGRVVPTFRYADPNISITVTPVHDGIEFTLENRTSHLQKIIWDEVAFVDVDTSSHRVMHLGVRYVDRYVSQPPSVVAPHNFLADKIIPVNRIVDDVKGFVRAPLLASDVRDCGESEAAFRSRAERVKDMPLSLLVPIDIGGIINEYMLNFQIDAVQVQTGRTCPDKRLIPEQESLRRVAN